MLYAIQINALRVVRKKSVFGVYLSTDIFYCFSGRRTGNSDFYKLSFFNAYKISNTGEPNLCSSSRWVKKKNSQHGKISNLKKNGKIIQNL